MSLFLYRKSNGEVLGMSEEAEAYTNVDETVYGVVDEPTIDAAVLDKNEDFRPGMKVFDGAVLRLATQQEMDDRQGHIDAENLARARKVASLKIQTDPVFNKVLAAILAATLDLVRDCVKGAKDPDTVTFEDFQADVVAKAEAGTFDAVTLAAAKPQPPSPLQTPAQP